MNEDRNYYSVEVMNYEKHPEHGQLVERHEVDDATELGELVERLEEEGSLDWPQELVVTKMTSLDAPLSDEEKEELDGFIETLKELYNSDKDYEYRVTES